MAVDPELLALVRCPRCRGALTLQAAGAAGAPPCPSLECATCRVAYPVVDDIPQLLIDEARPLGGATRAR